MHCEGLLFLVLSVRMRKDLLLIYKPNSLLNCKNHTLFETKAIKIDTLFLTKTAKNHTIWCRTYIALIRE